MGRAPQLSLWARGQAGLPPCHPTAFVSAKRLIGGGERQSLRARSPPRGAAWGGVAFPKVSSKQGASDSSHLSRGRCAGANAVAGCRGAAAGSAGLRRGTRACTCACRGVQRTPSGCGWGGSRGGVRVPVSVRAAHVCGCQQVCVKDVSQRQHIPAHTCTEGVDERNKCLQLLACTHPAECARMASRALRTLRCSSVRTRARLHAHTRSEALRRCFAGEPPPLGACVRVPPPRVRTVTLLHAECPRAWPWLTPSLVGAQKAANEHPRAAAAPRCERKESACCWHPRARARGVGRSWGAAPAS